jgi:hypothetical protein
MSFFGQRIDAKNIADFHFADDIDCYFSWNFTDQLRSHVSSSWLGMFVKSAASTPRSGSINDKYQQTEQNQSGGK